MASQSPEQCEAESYLYGADYAESFDSSMYVKTYYNVRRGGVDFQAKVRIRPVLQKCHDIFQSLPTGISVLDYGSGSSLWATISGYMLITGTKASK